MKLLIFTMKREKIIYRYDTVKICMNNSLGQRLVVQEVYFIN